MLIAVAVVAALGVAGIGGARSFNAVSEKFDSPLVPLVADGMIVACTALRLAALTRGWRIPGALVTTYVFIGGTVWLNIDTAHGIADAVAHALAPLAYAVLVEMLAHLLRLHMKLAQPAKPKLSALTWFTSPVITTRVWLHLSRTGTDDPAAARALVQQVVRMASRLATLCPSHKLWPFDAARAARTACLQTIRDGLLSASELAALLPATGRLDAGRTARAGRLRRARTDDTRPAARNAGRRRRAADRRQGGREVHRCGWSRTCSVHCAPNGHRTECTTPPAPHRLHRCAPTPSGAPAPVHAPHRTDRTDLPTPVETPEAAPRKGRADRRRTARRGAPARRAEHGGAPLGPARDPPRTEEAFGRPVGFGRAKRLQNWPGGPSPPPPTTTARRRPGDNSSSSPNPAKTTPENTRRHQRRDNDSTTELETSSSR